MTVAAAAAIPAPDGGQAAQLAVRAALTPKRSSSRARLVRPLPARPWPRRWRRARSRPPRPRSRRARALAPPLPRSKHAARRAHPAGSHQPARHRLPDPSPRTSALGCCSGCTNDAPLPSRSFAPRSCSPAHSPSSASSPIRPRRRVWPGSASPTPSRTATSTSTKVLSARSTTPYAAVPSMHIGYALIVAAKPAPVPSPPARARAWSALPTVRAARGRRHRQPLLLRRRRRRTGRRVRRSGGRPTDATRRAEPDQ